MANKIIAEIVGFVTGCIVYSLLTSKKKQKVDEEETLTEEYDCFHNKCS